MTEKKMGIGVAVLVCRDGEVLLGKRSDDPAKAGSELHGEGKWTIPGGKLDFGESFEAGAKRELEEETGIKAKNIEFISLSNENDMSETAHFVTVGFLCEDFDGEPVTKEPDEITEWKWFSLDELPQPMFRPAEKVIRNFMDGNVYTGQ